MTTPAALRELAACPFCGSEAMAGGGGDYNVMCMSCPASILGDTQEEATTAWNTRSQLRTAASEGGACHCAACDPPTFGTRSYRMVLCGVCGNKRCPHASDHRYVCTGSNATDQVPTLTHPPEVARDAGLRDLNIKPIGER